jgi:D-glycero-alpha-D-manno-heptose 1-phosphate guanylyltransferase
MDAVILAGGLGTRLRQSVSHVPKPMAPVAGRPFLEFIVSQLAAGGIDRAILSVGYMADKVIAHFGTRFGDMAIEYEVEPEPLGTGGAIRACLARCTADHALVLNGDTYLDLDLAMIQAQWHATHVPFVLARIEADTSRYGRILLTDGRVSGWSEKGTSGAGLINAGGYVVPSALMSDCKLSTPFSFENDYLKHEIHQRRFEVVPVEGIFVDIGVPESYALANQLLASRHS